METRARATQSPACTARRRRARSNTFMKSCRFHRSRIMRRFFLKARHPLQHPRHDRPILTPPRKSPTLCSIDLCSFHTMERFGSCLVPPSKIRSINGYATAAVALGRIMHTIGGTSNRASAKSSFEQETGNKKRTFTRSFPLPFKRRRLPRIDGSYASPVPTVSSQACAAPRAAIDATGAARQSRPLSVWRRRWRMYCCNPARANLAT